MLKIEFEQIRTGPEAPNTLRVLIALDFEGVPEPASAEQMNRLLRVLNDTLNRDIVHCMSDGK